MLLMILSASQVFAVQPEQVGEIRAEAVDTFGKPMSCRVLTLENLSTRKIIKVKAASDICVKKDLPVGDYRLTFTPDAFPSGTQTLSIKRGINVVQFILEFPAEYRPLHATLSGVVTNVGARKLWITLMGVFVDVHVKQKLNESGKFTFSGFPPGRYIACITDNGEVLHTSVIDVAVVNEPKTILLTAGVFSK